MASISMNNDHSVIFRSAKLIRVPLDSGKMGVGFRLENGENIHEIVLAYDEHGVTGMISSTSPVLINELLSDKRRMV